MTSSEPAFACDMSAIDAADRAKHLATIEALFGSVREMSELPNGYAFRLRDESNAWGLATDFVTLERLCCPFFDFDLRIERQSNSIYLSLTGREGVKPFIIAEVGRHLVRMKVRDEG